MPLGPLTRGRGEGALKENVGRVVPLEPSTPFLVQDKDRSFRYPVQTKVEFRHATLIHFVSHTEFLRQHQRIRFFEKKSFWYKTCRPRQPLHTLLKAFGLFKKFFVFCNLSYLEIVDILFIDGFHSDVINSEKSK